MRRSREVQERYGINLPEVYGSFTWGLDRHDSDIDLHYTLEAGAHLGWEIEDLVSPHACAGCTLMAVIARVVELVGHRAGVTGRPQNRV